MDGDAPDDHGDAERGDPQPPRKRIADQPDRDCEQQCGKQQPQQQRLDRERRGVELHRDTDER